MRYVVTVFFCFSALIHWAKATPACVGAAGTPIWLQIVLDKSRQLSMGLNLTELKVAAAKQVQKRKQEIYAERKSRNHCSRPLKRGVSWLYF